MEQVAEFTSNHPLLVTALIAMLLAVIFNELRLKSQGITSLPATMAVKLINQGAAVVDIREQEKFDQGHIVDSSNIAAAELEERELDKLKNKKAVLLVCETGMQSAKRAAELRKSGLETVFSLKGGIAGWRQENFPLAAN